MCETDAAPSRDELVNAAVEVGLRLEALAFRSGEAAFWLVQKFQEGPYPCVLGLAGPDSTWAARESLSSWPNSAPLRATPVSPASPAPPPSPAGQTAHGDKLVDAVGGFAGWGAILHTLTHLGALWRDESLLDLAERVAAPWGRRSTRTSTPTSSAVLPAA